MSVGLSGNLRDFGIADVFQLIGQQRKTGQLRIRQKESGALLFFNEDALRSELLEARLVYLTDALLRAGFREDEVAAILGGNALRIFRAVLP